MKFSRLISLCLGVTFGFSVNSLCTDRVVPSDRVVNSVNVRESPETDSPILGELRTGDEATLLVDVPHWYRVRLTDGVEGFVSKAWTDLVQDAIVDFQIHFLDVGTGDAAIIDIGESEIIIDGGDSVRVLTDYANETGIIDGPVELVVVTHADSDHWKGLNRLLGFDGKNLQPPAVLEFWEPGYNRDCRELESYTRFIDNVRGLDGTVFHRPLERTHPAAVETGQIDSIQLDTIPEVMISVLHTSQDPVSDNNDCAYLINNASIVLMIELAGKRFLFTGDANGKERNEPGPGTPGHIEERLLNLESSNPGTLKADLIKVPHHGSETASTTAFIEAVDPGFVIFSASTRHHLPRPTVVDRYQTQDRFLLRTDIDRRNDNDHILCYISAEGELDCNYLDVVLEN